MILLLRRNTGELYLMIHCMSKVYRNFEVSMEIIENVIKFSE